MHFYNQRILNFYKAYVKRVKTKLHMPVVWKSIFYYVKYYVLMTSSMSHQMPLGASILPFFDHLITLLPSYVTTVAGFAIFVTIFCHITALPFLCQILFPSPFWCHCESSLTMSHIKWVIHKNIPIKAHIGNIPQDIGVW